MAQDACRVDIWRNRCDRRSCKIIVSCVNFFRKQCKLHWNFTRKKVILGKYCVKIYPHHVQVNIYATFIGMGKYCVNIYPYTAVYGMEMPIYWLDCALLVELSYKSQQEWHFESFTQICRKFGVVAIYTLLCVKFWPQKRWSCKIFDKYHVWMHGSTTLLEKLASCQEKQHFRLSICWYFF